MTRLIDGIDQRSVGRKFFTDNQRKVVQGSLPKFKQTTGEDVDGRDKPRDKPGHDEGG
jgi:hypothetical protein